MSQFDFEADPQSQSSSLPRRPTMKGRGTSLPLGNRFEKLTREDDFDDVSPEDEQFWQSLQRVKTEYLEDQTESIVSENNSPDIGFRYSINPYRGCSHGCAYCYARPSHEYLGFNSGLDFESKIMVKYRAAELLRTFLMKEGWKAETIVFSGVTDCYQAAERDFRLTRQCLEVAAKAYQPIGIITKNALVVRDIDLLQTLAEKNAAQVYISITTLRSELARILEPRTSTPLARLTAIERLSAAGVLVGVMIGPVIPGLNDVEIPAILEAAASAGAKSAGMNLLRLPRDVKPIFIDWLERHLPLEKDRILTAIASTRDGDLSNSEFGTRMRGTGVIAEQIRQTFKVFRKKYNLLPRFPTTNSQDFRPPLPTTGQLRLF